ncbi:MAG TPA: VOC family protein [Candidatus Kapabacteria bacterium]|nr:VOC family protein [Candidatus Kapabacteria bacterium]HPO61710.1 VOC family protein [Candidatus Kapabacteria bacterium]
MKFICALITVDDIERSKAFYQNVLSQKIKFDYGENVFFEGDFAIHLKSHFQNLIDGKEIKSYSNAFELYFETDELDDIEKKLLANNVEFIHKTCEQPWKQKVLRFYDPDGNIIEIGERAISGEL